MVEEIRKRRSELDAVDAARAAAETAVAQLTQQLQEERGINLFCLRLCVGSQSPICMQSLASGCFPL